MPATGAIFLVVFAGSPVRRVRLIQRDRMFSKRLGIVVMVRMACVSVGSMSCLRSATATSPSGKGEQLLRSAAAQSGSTGHRQAEIRNEYKPDHDIAQTRIDSQLSVPLGTKVKAGFLASRHLLSVGGSQKKF